MKLSKQKWDQHLIIAKVNFIVKLGTIICLSMKLAIQNRKEVKLTSRANKKNRHEPP